MEELIGKEVRIYPGDTYTKQGIILEMTPQGILFEITSYNGTNNQYVVGKKQFIAYSASLTFREI